jgi:hypothetical protein
MDWQSSKKYIFSPMSLSSIVIRIVLWFMNYDFIFTMFHFHQQKQIELKNFTSNISKCRIDIKIIFFLITKNITKSKNNMSNFWSHYFYFS